MNCTCTVLPSPPHGWPDGVRAVHIRSSSDGTNQPALVYNPPPRPPPSSTAHSSVQRPLLLALHTWSASYAHPGGAQAALARWCAVAGWHFVHPNFRGPNRTPEACGSDLAVSDALDAVSYVKETTGAVDEDRVYAVGVSGGGHMALLLAGRAPGVWAGVSAWAPISDLRQWWREREGGVEGGRRYSRNVEAAVGGRPDDEGCAAAEECLRRSPLTYLAAAAKVNLDINAGVKDGRDDGGAVPFSHSLFAFDAVVPEAERLGANFIDNFYANQSPPLELEDPPVDPLYGKKDVVFRRVHKNVRVTVFRGGHEIIHMAALNWLAAQQRDHPAEWLPKLLHVMTVREEEGQSGK